ncbi:MAG: hypothetical protein ACLUZ6_02260 [Lachnospira eligens]
MLGAQAGEIKLQFTRMATGKWNIYSIRKTVQSLQKATKLKAQKTPYALSSISAYSEHSVKLTALITNYDPVKETILVSTGYYINEIGIFAKPQGAADTEEVLYSIAVVAGDTGDFMPPHNGYNPAQIVQDYYATVDNSTQVTIKTAGAALLAEDANVIVDDKTKVKYRLGIEDGNMYYVEVK